MLFASQHSVIKQLLGQILGSLPANLSKWLWRSQPSSIAYKLANLGLRAENLTIKQGIGAGLKFNVGDASLDYALGTNELPVQQALAKSLKPGDVFYDIGANIGFFTVIGAKLVAPSGQVYAFEPVPENAALVRQNARVNHFSTVTVLEKAVSHSRGAEELLLAHHPGGATLATAGKPPDLKGAMTVDLVSIDALVAEQVIKPPTVVKIDVEGAEIDVLCGMIQTIQDYKPKILYEIDDENEASLMRKSYEVEAFVQAFGYQIETLEESYPGAGWHVKHAIAMPNPSN